MSRLRFVRGALLLGLWATVAVTAISVRFVMRKLGIGSD